MEKVFVKLNRGYGNEFLTTSCGCVLYRKENSLGKKENVEEVNLSYPEINSLLKQNIIQIVDEKPKVEKSPLAKGTKPTAPFLKPAEVTAKKEEKEETITPEPTKDKDLFEV